LHTCAAAQGLNVACASVKLPDSVCNHWQTDLNSAVARDYQLFTTESIVKKRRLEAVHVQTFGLPISLSIPLEASVPDLLGKLKASDGKLKVMVGKYRFFVESCKDPACVFGYTCKCSMHTKMGAVCVGQCSSVFKSSGYCTISCLYKSAQKRKYTQKKAEVSKTDSFAFLQKRSDAFVFSTLHSWKDMPTSAQSVVFMFQVLLHYATNSNTPFVVAETTFLELRDKTEAELKVM
jgi:hypothetical protein